MKVIFVSGALDHISLPLCQSFFELLGADFHFVATRCKGTSRSDLGYGDMSDLYPFVIKAFRSHEEYAFAKEQIEKADAVIYGAAPEDLVKGRIQSGKLTFRFTERMYKDPFTPRNFLRRIAGAIRHHGYCQNKPVYILCAGAYVAADFAMYRYYKNRCFKWCYFTEISHKSYEQLRMLKEENEKLEIVWTARFLELKHPELVLQCSRHLAKEQIPHHITMIGGGELLDQVKEESVQLQVDGNITFTGAIPPEQARAHMEKADISLFTSDRREGWGAVVNEAMGCGCAVLASSAAGSSPLLINDGENGLLFDINSLEEFCDKVLLLAKDRQRREKLAQKAYEDIHTLWNARSAAENFLKLAEALLSGADKTPIKTGPCSVAPILKDGWRNV